MEKPKPNNGICLPVVLKVLLVDGDSSSLQETTKMIQSCGYKVMATTTARQALSILRENRSEFDIVVSDIDILDKVGLLKFMEIIALKLDLPLIVMSENNDRYMELSAVYSGACDHWTKPIKKDKMQEIWKHVVYKQKQKEMEKYKMRIGVENRAIEMTMSTSEGNLVTGIDNESHTSGETYKDNECNDIKNEASGKKPRMVWTQPLHEKFVTIVNELGIKNAVPKKILEMMNVKGLTRENVASHLQKYRMYTRKNEENTQLKAKMQAEAINRAILNSQNQGNNIRGQANSPQNSSQLLGQKRPNPNFPLSIRRQNLNQTPTEIYGAEMESRSKYDVLAEPDQQRSALDQFSDFKISNYYDNKNEISSLVQRPLKVQKVSDYETHNEGLADELYPFSTIDDSARVTSHFIEPDFLHQNGANVYDNVMNSGSDRIYFNQNFGLGGFSDGDNEQFDGHFDDCHTNNNSN